MNFHSFYSRQMKLPEIGVKGQKQLQQAKCLVVGAGGLGSSALSYLAASGIGTIGISDGDLLEESNLHRQVLYSSKDIGKQKAELAAQRLRDLNPLIEVISHPFRCTYENAEFLFSSYDLILDCTDSFRTKFLLNDAAYLLKKPLIRASLYQFEGELQVYLPERKDPCLRCLWQERPEDGCVGNCEQVGILGPVAGFFGVLQALEAIKFFLNMPNIPGKTTIFFDLTQHNKYELENERRQDCPLCGQNPKIHGLSENEVWEIVCIPSVFQHYCCVDIREPHEIHAAPVEQISLNMPLSTFDSSVLKKDASYLFFCQKGRRSASLVRKLREEGWENVYSLLGGASEILTAKR